MLGKQPLKKLTKKQMEVVLIYYKFLSKGMEPPSIRNVSVILNVNMNAALCRVNRLVEKNWMRKGDTARAKYNLTSSAIAVIKHNKKTN